MSALPIPEYNTPPGHHFEIGDCGPGWRAAIASEAARKCRGSGPGTSCREPIVGVLRRPVRGTNGVDYFYCREHFTCYGAWVEDGRAVRWRTVADDEKVLPIRSR